jgi:cell division protein FtsZ
MNYGQRAPEVEQNEYYEQPDPRITDDRRGHKGGWLSLFGSRPRQVPVVTPLAADPIPQFRNQNAGQATARQIEEIEPQAGDDLEIPSFLRRLAN